MSMVAHSLLTVNKFKQLVKQGKITLGGNAALKIYGTLHCPPGKRMKKSNRVFFSNEDEAIAAGYRPCGHCMRQKYNEWKLLFCNMQQSFFEETGNILPHNGETLFFPHAFTKMESDNYYQALINEIVWRHEAITIFGKPVMQPRLTAWYGDIDKSYSYSGITMQPLAWTGTLLAIKQMAENIASIKFNSALLNYYRDGNDSMGWHRDNEKELGPNPVIASVSFGAARKFRLRYYTDKKIIKDVLLTHGSLLLMRGQTQHYWEHSLPKITKPTGGRVNITFRIIT